MRLLNNLARKAWTGIFPPLSVRHTQSDTFLMSTLNQCYIMIVPKFSANFNPESPKTNIYSISCPIIPLILKKEIKLISSNELFSGWTCVLSSKEGLVTIIYYKLMLTNDVILLICIFFSDNCSQFIFLI